MQILNGKYRKMQVQVRSHGQQKGYSWQTRLSIDDMSMIPVIQTHAYKVTGELKYVERAANGDVSG